MFEFPRLWKSAEDKPQRKRYTHACSVRRLSILFIVVSDFVEVVLVELANEAGKIAMLEVFREDRFGEALILDARSDPVSVYCCGD